MKIREPYIKVGRLKSTVARNAHWEVKTAEQHRLLTVKNKALIWSAAKHSDNGNGNRPN